MKEDEKRFSPINSCLPAEVVGVNKDEEQAIREVGRAFEEGVSAVAGKLRLRLPQLMDRFNMLTVVGDIQAKGDQILRDAEEIRSLSVN